MNSRTEKQEKRETGESQICCPKKQKTRQTSRPSDDIFDFPGHPIVQNITTLEK